MNQEIDDLLTRLEEVSARAVASPGPELHEEFMNSVQERGELIQELQPVLTAHAPVCYAEWNRLVVIHHQGSRIEENLRRVRSEAALELGASSSGRVFLERVTGMLAPAANQS